jgi:hypothetical protein
MSFVCLPSAAPTMASLPPVTTKVAAASRSLLRLVAIRAPLASSHCHPR